LSDGLFRFLPRGPDAFERSFQQIVPDFFLLQYQNLWETGIEANRELNRQQYMRRLFWETCQNVNLIES
jgi:hypothetical protein